MANSPDQLVGQIAAQIDGRFKVTLTTFNVSVDVPTTIPGGAFGKIGSSQGNQNISGAISFVIQSALGAEIDADDLSSGYHEFSYPVANRRYVLQGFLLNKADMNVDNDAGTMKVSGSFVAVRRIRVK